MYSTLTMRKLEHLIAEILKDCHDEEQQTSAFLNNIVDNIPLPVEASLAGSSVTVLGFSYTDSRRGIIAKCCSRADGRTYEIAAEDLEIGDSTGANRIAAYRTWLGLNPYPTATANVPKPARIAHPNGTIELAVMTTTRNHASCRIVGSGALAGLVLLKPTDAVPGEILVTDASGKILSRRCDARALNLTPLKLQNCGNFDPGDHDWGDPDQPLADWVRPIIAWGLRPRYEMEQVLVDDFNDALDRAERENKTWQKAILLELCGEDLRCLDAHAHLGLLAFNRRGKNAAAEALRHYEVGVRIGELSLGADFDGVLPWGLIDNRPFLRCMHGYGLSLWRVGRFDETLKAFDRMLWLNPDDNQGVRMMLDQVRAKISWDTARFL